MSALRGMLKHHIGTRQAVHAVPPPVGGASGTSRRPGADARLALALIVLSYATAAGAFEVDLVAPDAACRYLIPTNNSLGLSWTQAAPFDDTAWTPGQSGLGYEPSPGPFAPFIQTPLPVSTRSVFVRWTFAQTNALAIDALTLRMQYDDGFVAYLNGERVAESRAPAEPLYNSLATEDRPDAWALEFEDFDLTMHKDLLHPGVNVLAIQVMNHGTHPAIADMLLRPALVISAYEPVGGGGVLINEIHCNPENNAHRLEFVELHNPGPEAIPLAGWSFTAGIGYTFGADAVLPPNGYVVVAESPAAISNRFQVAAYGPFTGRLSANGETLVLRNGLGAKVDEVTYGMGFPWPTVGDAPGPSMQLLNPSLDNDLGGSWRSAPPTPAAPNAVLIGTPLIPPQIRQVKHTPTAPTSGADVIISAKVTDPDGVAAVTLAYQLVDPGQYITLWDAAYSNTWTSLPMRDDGADGDAFAGDDTFTVRLPGALQTHRRLVRYRITVSDTRGNTLRVPYADDPQPNFAYFVYDGVPAWTAADRPGVTPPVTYDATVMNQLPVYHLLARKTDIENCTWIEKYSGDLYRWTGAMVYDGRVYDHVRFRARGGVWRYAMGKNMWKFKFNRGHYFQARDDYGNLYPEKRDNLNFSACIQQGDYNHRGEQGMFEAVGFRLFNLAASPAPKTHWTTFRIIDDASETGPNQYSGDFWGLYLVVEQIDGHFLDEHNLPDGNLYKWEADVADQSNQGRFSPTNKADVTAFVPQMRTKPPEPWWRLNVNLDAYYGYRTIVEGIHHYDQGNKNWYYYFDPTVITNAFGVSSQRCALVAWDLDLTWANNMYSDDREPFRVNGALNFPATAIEYRNRIRELRDLLFNTDEGWRLIDEHAFIVGRGGGPAIVDADRAMWDYHPVMINSSYINLSKAGHGRFYQVAPTRDFAGMVKIMRDYVASRGSGTLDSLAADAAIPHTPTASALTTSFAINDLRFQCAPFSDPQGNQTFAAMRWRLGEITNTNAPGYVRGTPGVYEIDAVWDSGTLTQFVDTVTLPNHVAKVGRTYRLRVRMQDDTGRWSRWSAPVAFAAAEPDTGVALVDHLRVTELMYQPLGGAAFEFIELHNTSPTETLNLDGAKFTDGIDFVFPAGTFMPPETYLLVVQASPSGNFGAFRTRYGLAEHVPIAGPYSGNLNNAGELLALKTASAGTVIFSTAYSNGRGWPLAAAGAGHSLVPRVSPDAARQTLDYGGNWRASTFIDGSPGAPDPSPLPGPVLNEIMAHTDHHDPARPEYDSNDWIELYNPDAEPAVLTDWFLSDNAGNLRKWAIPAGTTIPAGGWKRFDEVNDFHNPITNGFGLDKTGEQVFLSHLPGAALDRVADAVAFKGQENHISWGRYPDGDPWWRALAPPTPGALNAGPLASVVISELMYNPAPTEAEPEDNTTLEYIELYNPTGGPVTLANAEVGAWRVGGGVDLTFPADTILAAGEHLLLVGFDPDNDNAARQTFLLAYVLTNTPPRLLGPYAGRLSNRGERLALERGVAPDRPGQSISWAIVDEVIYFDRDPWPPEADGNGPSLHRRHMHRPGNDPANWSAAYGATPGSAAEILEPPSPYETWAQDHFGDSGLPGGGPGDDWDNDGMDNWSEYLAGTDPTDPTSRLTLSIGIAGPAAVIDWLARSATGEAYTGLTRVYTLESKTNMLPGPWLPVPGFSDVPGNDLRIAHTNLTSEPHYYRLKVILSP